MDASMDSPPPDNKLQLTIAKKTRMAAPGLLSSAIAGELKRLASYESL